MKLQCTGQNEVDLSEKKKKRKRKKKKKKEEEEEGREHFMMRFETYKPVTLKNLS
jgi:hypothetical protein